MEKKKAILEVIILLIAAVVYTVTITIPHYKKSIGSSDKFIKTSIYKNMYEINIDGNVNFALLENNEQKIYHIFFFEMNSTCLYNQNIENKSINDATLETIKILIENNYLNANSKVYLTKYNDDGYNKFKNIFETNLKEYNVINDIIENENTMQNKAKELSIDNSNDNETILKYIDIYSKDLTITKKSRNKKKNIDIDEEEPLSKSNAKTYTNNVFKRIEKYVYDNNIKYINSNTTTLPINLIPADNNEKYYPTSNSWYYVNDGKIYAYIELNDFNETYGYCYEGSIDKNYEGMCLNEKTS